jgi:uncharacterized protein (DUF4415 family)
LPIADSVSCSKKLLLIANQISAKLICLPTAKVDADVLAWLKSEGDGYQTRMNAILRREMLASVRRG